MKLTPKREKFVQCLVEGMSQADAYRAAYSAKNMSNNTIYKEASLLMSDPKVAERYQELLEEAQSKAVMTAQERMEWLSDVIRGNVQEEVLVIDGDGNEVKKKLPAKLDTKLKANDQLNKMSGEYKTIVDGSLEINKKLEDLL